MIVFSDVFFGLPLYFFVMESASFNDSRTAVSAFRRIIYPKKFNLLRRIVMLHRSSFVIRYNFSVDIFLGHLIPIAFLSNLRLKESILSSKVLFRPHNSELSEETL